MHHVVLEQWSRRRSFLHARDARAKTLATAVLLITIGTADRGFEALAPACFALLGAVALAARLPLGAALQRAAVVLPFCMVFAAVSLLGGETRRAALLVSKSYLSALAVLLLVASTPLPQLLRGLESLGVPRFLLMVTQFVYRYLFVISEQAQHMRMAAAGRGARFRAAAGALAVLFSRSYARAESIHRAMLARGFAGRLPTLAPPAFRASDAAFLAGACALTLALRLGLERWL